MLDIGALRGKSATKRMAIKLHAVSDHAPTKMEVDVLRAHVGKGLQRWPLHPQPKAEARKREVDRQAEIWRNHRKLLRCALLPCRSLPLSPAPPSNTDPRFQVLMCRICECERRAALRIRHHRR